eukprot:1216509-Pleurochrysis_carterae.AAC.1
MGSDGNIIGEFRLMERYMLAVVTQQSNDAYVCDVLAKPYLHCLDLSSYTNPVLDFLVEDEFGLGINTTIYSNMDLFGQGVSCDGKRHGDGMINVFDLIVLLAYMFGRFPSLPADPSIVSTGLQGRSDVHKRCGT